MLAVGTPHCLTTPLIEHLSPPDVGVHALHPRTYSVIDEGILAQERESIQEDARGINLKILYNQYVILLQQDCVAGPLQNCFACPLQDCYAGDRMVMHHTMHSSKQKIKRITE